MPAYLIMQISVTDPQKMERYRNAVVPLIAAHGGKSVVRRATVEVLEGRAPDRPLSIIEFPSMDALHGFWNSPEYQPVKELRRDAASLDIWAVEVAG